MSLTLQTVAQALGGEVSNGQVTAPGPGHSAGDRSLSVKLDATAPDGFLVHSFAGDDPIGAKDFVRSRLGLPAFKARTRGYQVKSPQLVRSAIMAVVAGQSHETKPRGGIIATYDYTDTDGALLYQCARYEPKDFRQRRPDGNGGWMWNLGERRVVYRWPELIKFPDATVFICEGEKDADRVASLGHCASCVAGGRWMPECIAALAGRDCIILEDNDDAGRKKSAEAAQALQGTAKTIRIVALPNLPDKGDVSDWLEVDPRRAEQLVAVCLAVPEWEPELAPVIPAPANLGSWRFHADVTPPPPRWLVKQILPETGVAIMSGQWGTFKTTVALDLSVCVMALPLFAGKYRIKRRGAVLYLALEGGGTLPARLAAIAGHYNVTGVLPFAWRSNCPPLMDANAANVLSKLADEAAAELKRNFDLPVSLIWVDTLITAAGHESGGDNDTAASQKMMKVLRALSDHTGALVVGIDHFGKVVETGTRGSSAKEADADAVLALLGDRELSGGIKNSRAAMRKQRDGLSGFEIPFTPRIVETGTDEDGEPITAAVIDWQAARKTNEQDKTGWTKSLRVFQRVLTTTLASIGKDVRPFADGPMVCACDVEAVRKEFYLQYPADGTEAQKSDARRKAFKRYITSAVSSELVCVRDLGGEQLVWLTKADTANAAN